MLQNFWNKKDQVMDFTMRGVCYCFMALGVAGIECYFIKWFRLSKPVESVRKPIGRDKLSPYKKG